MIECPYCQTSVDESAPECPECRIDGEKLARMMGPMPVIYGGVSHGSRLLNPRDVKRLAKVIDKFERRFPQSRLHLLARSFPQEMDFRVILFWVFNQAGLSPDGHQGGKNRDVILVIDPSRSKAGITVGYGLEPILSQKAMDEIVGGGQSSLRENDLPSAFEEMVRVLTDRMREVSMALPEAVGLRKNLVVDHSNDY